MIRSSSSVMTATVTVSVALHVAALYAFYSDTPVQIEGGAGAVVEARLGNSFADLAAGVMTPAEPDVTQSESVEQVVPAPVQDTAQHQPVQTPAELAPVVPPAAPQMQPTVPVLREALAPTQAPAPELETIAATEPEPVEVSPRPPERPKPAAARREPVKQTPAPKSQPKGNSKQNASAGSATGSAKQSASAKQSSGQARATASGNAAASNYPGKVMRKISRVRRPRVGVRGATLVRFSINGNGGLGAVSVAKSSGSSKLDQAAVQVIRRAAPFPPPPPGAQKSFSIKIEGRG